MFGTVIIDAYTKDETEQLAIAIDDLCNPTDSYGWASAGIYSFWATIRMRFYILGWPVILRSDSSSTMFCLICQRTVVNVVKLKSISVLMRN